MGEPLVNSGLIDRRLDVTRSAVRGRASAVVGGERLMPRDSAYPSRRMLLAGLGAGAVGVAAAAHADARSSDGRRRSGPVGLLVGPNLPFPQVRRPRRMEGRGRGDFHDWTRPAARTCSGSPPSPPFPKSGPRPVGSRPLPGLFGRLRVGLRGRSAAADRLYQLVHRSYPALPSTWAPLPARG